MTVMRTSWVIAMPPEVPVRQILPLTTVVSFIDAVSTVTPFVVPPPPDIERPVMQAQDFSNFRLPRPCCRGTQQRIRRLSFRSVVFRLYEGINRLRLERPCCSRRQMMVWFRVWMFQTLPGGVSCFRGQNPFVLHLHVRRSGLYCRPDPPVLLTGSVFRISMTLPEGSSTSATPMTPGEGGWLQSGLLSRPYRYSESGDLLCSDGNLV